MHHDCTGICYIFTHLGDILLYLSLVTLDFLALILVVAIPIVFVATIVSGIWWLICTAYEQVSGTRIPSKNRVFGAIWASAMALIVYRASHGKRRRY